jgi:hypothetical protein
VAGEGFVERGRDVRLCDMTSAVASMVQVVSRGWWAVGDGRWVGGKSRA